jgi:hypothetical protein
VKVGDLVKCGNEYGIVIGAHWTTEYPQSQFVTVVWSDGEKDQFEPRFYDLEVISEGR